MELAALSSLLAIWDLHFPPAVALAAVAVLGYLVGRRRKPAEETNPVQAHRELKRAQTVARELERISSAIERGLTGHRACVERFKRRLSQLQDVRQERTRTQLCEETEEMLRPTLLLTAQISQACDEIRQQSNQLMAFTQMRTDPLTGLCNRRALDEALAAQHALWTRYGASFSLAMFDIDHFKRINDEQGHQAGDRKLESVARKLDEAARETDLVARYGGEEFVIVMPQTDLAGAVMFCERLRRSIEQTTAVTLSGGVATAVEGEMAKDLVGRADAAMYEAKAAGRNRIFQHTGEGIAECEAMAAALA